MCVLLIVKNRMSAAAESANEKAKRDGREGGRRVHREKKGKDESPSDQFPLTQRGDERRGPKSKAQHGERITRQDRTGRVRCCGPAGWGSTKEARLRASDDCAFPKGEKEGREGKGTPVTVTSPRDRSSLISFFYLHVRILLPQVPALPLFEKSIPAPLPLENNALFPFPLFIPP